MYKKLFAIGIISIFILCALPKVNAQTDEINFTSLGKSDEIAFNAETKGITSVGILYTFNIKLISNNQKDYPNDDYELIMHNEVQNKINSVTYDKISVAEYNSNVGSKSTTDSHGANKFTVNGQIITSEEELLMPNDLILISGNKLVPKIWYEGQTFDTDAKTSRATNIKLAISHKTSSGIILTNYVLNYLFRVPTNEENTESKTYTGNLKVFIPFYSFKGETITISPTTSSYKYDTLVKSIEAKEHRFIGLQFWILKIGYTIDGVVNRNEQVIYTNEKSTNVESSTISQKFIGISV